MFTFYTDLPTELQLRVLNYLPAVSFCNVLKLNTSMNSLGLSSIHSTINNLIDNENRSIFISIYSSQNKQKLIETFNTICVSHPSSQLHTPSFEKSNQSKSIDMNKLSDKLNDLSNKSKTSENSLLFKSLLPSQSQNLYNTTFQFGNLEYTKNPLKLQDNQIPAKYSKKTSAMSLVVSEDEPFIKVQFEMQLQSESSFKPLFKFNSKLNQIQKNNTSISGTLLSDNKAVSIDYILHKGDEIPPRCGYDYDVFHNYVIEFGNVQINTAYLLHCYEQNI